MPFKLLKNLPVLGILAFMEMELRQDNKAIFLHVLSRAAADHYEQKEECLSVPGCLSMGIGARTQITKTIVDKNARIGSDCMILNKERVVEATREEHGFVIKDQIVVILKNAAIQNGTII